VSNNRREILMNAIDPPVTAQSHALAARYGTEIAPSHLPWNDVISSLMQHRSVRGYKTDPVPAGTLATMVAAAQSAATSSNLQTWSVVEVTDPAKRAELAEIAGGQKHIVECPLYLVWLADLSRNERIAQAEGKALEGAPYLETFLVAAIDAALAAQNAVVAAESLGLSTVYIGAMRNDPVRVAKLLGLPPGAGAVFGLCVGYARPASAGEVKPRLPQDVVLHRDRYSLEPEKREQANYDARLAAFSARNEMAGASTWTSRVVARMSTIKALNGRERLKEAFIALGFPLR
jgi:nitroreductase